MFCEHLSAMVHLGLPFRQVSIPLLLIAGLHTEVRLTADRNNVICLNDTSAHMGLASIKSCKPGVVSWNMTRRRTWTRTTDNRRSACDLLVASSCGSALVFPRLLERVLHPLRHRGGSRSNDRRGGGSLLREGGVNFPDA